MNEAEARAAERERIATAIEVEHWFDYGPLEDDTEDYRAGVSMGIDLATARAARIARTSHET